MLQAVIWYATLPLLSVALLLAVVRLLRGPSLPDRVVALDLIAIIAIAMIATFAIGTGEAFVLDVVIAIALVVFLGTVGFAHYLELKGGDD
jgi:multicomponent Na+:H+ antiporter subunit F